MLAPHTTPKTIGDFREVSVGNYFTYRESQNDWGLALGYPHEVFTGHYWIPAKVLKTVAHIVVDEAEFNTAVVEKWDIKQHNIYPKD
jgi:hypothetical protein